MKRFSAFMVIAALIVAGLPSPVLAETFAAPFVISEIQTGSYDASETSENEKPEWEFIELHNQTGVDLDVTNWRVQYFKADSTDVQDGTAAPTSGREIKLDGIVSPYGYVLLSFDQYLDDADVRFAVGSSGNWLAKTGGHLRIIDGENQVVDVVGWGTAKQPETTAVDEIPVSSSAQRKADPAIDDSLVDTNDNQSDFGDPSETPTPQFGSLIKTEEVPQCHGVLISEILPNPAGDDAGKEFIELHNPTNDLVGLSGCSLGLRGSDDEYQLPADVTIQPGGYSAFYDVPLSNSAGGEVLLIIGDTEESVTYPAELKDGIAWAFINSAWRETNNPTPGSDNRPMTQEEDTGGKGSDELEPCPRGKFRNPLTNRCKSIALATAALTPCKAGQVRNPETNRCRNATLASVTALTPCKPGQERNPATNRCRKVESADMLKACGEGEERNPDTNRCRKVAATLASTTPGDKQSDGKQAVNYGLIGLVSSSAIGYGLYEYRNDFRNKFANLRSKFFPGKSGE